jgi:hypothetical protein
MGFHYYNYSIWVEKDADFSMEKLKNILENVDFLKKPDVSILLQNKKITIVLGNYHIWLPFMQDSFVEQEAQESSERHTRLKNCNARIDMYAEDDPDEKFYNQQLILVETIGNLKGTHIYDPYLGEWIN